MKYLMEQEELETLLGRGPNPDEKTPPFTVIYFTATWCGACRSIDLSALEAAFPAVNWLKCDVDQNNYSPGYCGIRSIPTFIAIKDKKIVGQLQSNDNGKITEWIKGC